MTKSWRHEVSIPWLQARRDVLTASEIKAMLPEYKRMLKKPEGETSQGFFALCGAKLSNDIPDPESVGAAARGHIMEPYAVTDWNNNQKNKYHHWDDVIIKRNGIGFSPDALDIEQKPIMGVELWYDEHLGKLITPDRKHIFIPAHCALEVKCYEPKAHMKEYLTNKEDRDERLQIAVAFMVLPKLKHVDILWYCPEAPIPMYNERYKKSDLKNEIDIITNMVKMFHHHMALIKHYQDDWSRGGMAPMFSTDDIYNIYCKEQSEGFMRIK